MTFCLLSGGGAESEDFLSRGLGDVMEVEEDDEVVDTVLTFFAGAAKTGRTIFEGDFFNAIGGDAISTTCASLV